MTAARRIVPALVLALVAAACGGGGDTASGGGPTTSGAPRIDTNAELKVGFTQDDYILDGPDANLATYPLNTNVIETLIRIDENYNLVPMLAERWEFIAPNTWRFHLRRNVTFHDGQRLTAEAVRVGLFERVAQRRNGGTIRSAPGAAKVVDEHTIDFTSAVTNLRVPQQIVHPQNGVVAPNTDYGTKPIGTGPFRFVSYQPKERIAVERNPNYWDDAPKVARITFRFYPDASARLLALQAGDIDLAYEVPRQDAASLRSAGFRVNASPVGAYEAMYVNVKGSPPFDILQDRKVREAVAMAVNRPSLVGGVLDGLATDDQTFVPPGTLGPHAGLIKGFRYDEARAKALLDEAGWTVGPGGIRTKGGRRLELTLVSGFPSAEAHRPIPTYLQAELKKVGIDVKVVEHPDSTSFYDQMKKKEGDLWLEQGNQNDANPGFLPILLFYTGPGSSGSGTVQGIAAPGAKFDQLIAPSLTEPDLGKVQQSVASALHEMIDEQITVIPLAGIVRVYGMRKGIENFRAHPSFLNVSWLEVGVAR